MEGRQRVSIVFQVLSSPDIIEVFNYANARLERTEPDANDRMFKSWSAKWRKEALEHYLKLGWSFIVRDEARVGPDGKPTAVGFFLAQPFLFFRGQTQTLWVEHIEADSEAVKAELVEVAVKVAREKHLQRVLFSDAQTLTQALEKWPATQLENEDRIVIVKTTKG